MEDQRELKWRKSSYSGGNGGGCVEVADRRGVLVRDSQLGEGSPILGPFTAAQWREFVATVRR